MGKENFIQNKMIPIAIGALILIALAAIIPAYLLLNISGVKYFEFGNFMGINLVLIVAGSIFLAFALIRQWNICIDHSHKQADKGIEQDQMNKQQAQLNKDASERRIFERERDQINDLFRLIELAKETTEVSESAPTTDKADKLLVRIVNKHTVLDMKKLDQLVAHYHSLNTQHKTE